MKKLLAIFLTVLLILTACGEEKKEYVEGKNTLDNAENVTDPMLSANASAEELVISEETVKLSWRNLNLNLNGEFYRDDIQDYTQEKTDRLNFIDFDSMISIVVCPKPNCTHTDSSDCSSFGMTNHATAIGNKIYYFEVDSHWKNENEFVNDTYIWQADIDGSNRIRLFTIEDLLVSEYDIAAVKESTVYFIGECIGLDEETLADTGWNGLYLCSFDFVTKEFKNYGLLTEGYNAVAVIRGEYVGGLYISSSSMDELFEEKINVFGATEEEIEAYSQRQSEFNSEHKDSRIWCLDIKTEELSVSDMPTFENGGFVCFGLYGVGIGDGILKVADSVGHIVVYDDFNYDGGTPINGFVFNTFDLTALELATGKVYNLNDEIFPQFFDMIAYHDSCYIYRDSFTDFPHYQYAKIPADEIFKE